MAIPNLSFKILFYLVLLFPFLAKSESQVRVQIPLNESWVTTANDTNKFTFDGFEKPDYTPYDWGKVNVPHNWDKYEGYRRKVHGNRHGYAWYRKDFAIDAIGADKKVFLFFEGVGSYATVWLNGKMVGKHAGGRTTFTLDVTKAINKNGEKNILAVRADNPPNIRDLPWVCGGCSPEWGFSEGSQPMGIFRPVSLIITNGIRVEPFGVHIWNDTTVSEKYAEININTEIKNYSPYQRKIEVVQKLVANNGAIAAQHNHSVKIAPGETKKVEQHNLEVTNPVLWSIDNPHLYKLKTQIFTKGQLIDEVETSYGIRWISWHKYRNDGDNRFYLNGKPVFINGTAEYEHMLGQSHAFSNEQVRARVMQMKEAGFNAFRDAHQPHNLRYQHSWDSLGMLFWTQMAAHIWFDNEAFKNNFKQLLRDWVKERRNCPSVILYGLENESTLPTWFAEECVDIIREMDPTSPYQRLVTTCNGGTGTDWNVVQNWSGTYAGDLYAYDKDLSREILNGEYGAWRSIDLHTEGPFQKDGAYSEDRMCQLMETKVRLGEKAKDSCAGQFQWIFNSHDNPGRTQNGEGLREIDRIGPVNYKGLITPWGEPLDVYYMYMSNYASYKENPMVYIASHTWPNRWTTPGIKDSITVYSNCDEVELFNGYLSNSLGKKKNKGKGYHFQWDGVEIQYNVLTAIGYVNKQPVDTDRIVLFHLPEAPDFNRFFANNKNLTQPHKNLKYLYRVNCGGPEYTDQNGNTWWADQQKTDDNSWGSKSWTDHFNNYPAFLASQRRTFDPIIGDRDWSLFQTFRYGKDQLKYEFNVPNGLYSIELFFTEPWYGIGDGATFEGWRIFDIAINGELKVQDLDLSKTGHDHAFKIVLETEVKNGKLIIDFPTVKVGQAIISAVAIAGNTAKEKVEKSSIIENMESTAKANWEVKKWMDIGQQVYADTNILFNQLPPNFYGAEWLSPSSKNNGKYGTLAQFKVNAQSDIFIALDANCEIPYWMNGYVDQGSQLVTDEKGGKAYKIYAKRFEKDRLVELKSIGASYKGSLMYIVAICPVTQLGYAADQRPKTRYVATEENIHGDGLVKEEFKNRQYYAFEGDNTDTIHWEFKVGLGDTYGVEFKYLNNTGDTIPMVMKIIDMYGIVANEKKIYFDPRKDSWRTKSTTTGTSINAGTYQLKLFPLDKKGLGIHALDIQ